MKKSRVGAVLMSAALLDDVVGLVIAGVIANLVPPSASANGGVNWRTVVRPILVSLAYALGTPLLAILARIGLVRVQHHPHILLAITRNARFLKVTRSHVHLFVIVSTLAAFVATSHLAGTSELFGAYLAGAFLGHVFNPQHPPSPKTPHGSTPPANPILVTFTSHISHTLLHPLLSPLFFASIGASIPVNQLFTVYLPSDGGVKSHRVVWRGFVYSVLMILAKAVTGLWVFAFWKREPQVPPNASQPTPDCDLTTVDAKPSPRWSKALLLGLAMVARGEIALIVAQLARPLLTSTIDGTTSSEEPFVIVTWAILITTFAGAFAVGLVVRGIKNVARVM